MLTGVRRRRLGRDAATVAFLATIAALANLAGLPYILFPELAALAYDVIGNPQGRWARVPLLLVVTPTLVAVLGMEVTRYLPYGLPAILIVAGGGILILRALRSPIFPALSAGVLPLVFGITSWRYPLAVLLASGLLALVSILQRQLFPAREPPPRLDPTRVPPAWLAEFVVFLCVAYAAVALTGARMVLYPPLVVTAYHMLAERPRCPWVPRVSRLPLACFLTACAGDLAYAVLGDGPISVACAVAASIAILRRLDAHVPPALAVALIPFVAGQATLAYPFAVGLGASLATLAFMIHARRVGSVPTLAPARPAL